MGMREWIRFVDRLAMEALIGAVVAVQAEDFTDDAAAWLPLDMHDEIDGLRDLRLGIGKGRLRVIAHHEIGEAGESFCR